jgi:hypothetical protein
MEPLNRNCGKAPGHKTELKTPGFELSNGFCHKIGLCGGEGVFATQHNTATHIKFRCVAQN